MCAFSVRVFVSSTNTLSCCLHSHVSPSDSLPIQLYSIVSLCIARLVSLDLLAIALGFLMNHSSSSIVAHQSQLMRLSFVIAFCVPLAEPTGLSLCHASYEFDVTVAVRCSSHEKSHGMAKVSCCSFKMFENQACCSSGCLGLNARSRISVLGPPF